VKTLAPHDARGVGQVIALALRDSDAGSHVILTTEQGRQFRVPLERVIDDWSKGLKWSGDPQRGTQPVHPRWYVGGLWCRPV
jgi:hypothetical protein